MDNSAGSRLLQMQARFQQKQMAEREQKIASLYEAQQTRALERVRHSPVGSLNTASHLPGKGPPGKYAPLSSFYAPTTYSSYPILGSKLSQDSQLRQMFEERRTKAGIDKSYPLQPINNRKPVTNGLSKPITNGHSKPAPEFKKPSVRSNGYNGSVSKRPPIHKTENIFKGQGDMNHNHESDVNHNKYTPSFSTHHPSGDTRDETRGSLIEDETFPEALAPARTPRSPATSPRAPERPARRNQSGPKPSPPQPVAPPRKSTADSQTTADRKQNPENMQRVTNPIHKSQPSVQSTSKSRSSPSFGAGVGSAGSSAGGGAGEPCAVCGRRFAPDRLAKHEAICKRTSTKKRKPYDVLKHRLAGTEAEQFIGKIRKAGGAGGAGKATSKASLKPINNTWRKKHEDFIKTIRAAKQVQQHLAAGGKISDLPPPPPSENPDYVQCPHCSRRFNQQAAERHIPKCAEYQFNKPKPAPKQAPKKR